MHEFESLLFSDVTAFNIIANNKTVAQLEAVRNEFQSPEYINNSVSSSPSKRLEVLIPDYKKVFNGIEIATIIGIDAILAECLHFREWVQKICTLAA